MIKKLVILLLTTVCLLVPTKTLASSLDKEIWVEDAQVLVGGADKVTIQPGKTLELNENEKVQVVFKLCKTPGSQGIITLLSDLTRVEGPTKLRLEDYPEPFIEVRCSGIVPDALLKEGKLSKVGEASFVLLNITYDRDGISRTVMTVSAIATNPELNQCKLTIQELEKSISDTPLNERQSEMAKELLSSAKQARDSGNPGLAISLCGIAREAFKARATDATLSVWYWLVLMVLIIAFTVVLVILISQNKQKHTGWIRPRR